MHSEKICGLVKGWVIGLLLLVYRICWFFEGPVSWVGEDFLFLMEYSRQAKNMPSIKK